MKKLLATIALTLGVLTLASTTHAGTWYDPVKTSDIYNQFCSDSKRMDKTLVVLDVDFGFVRDDFYYHNFFYGEDPQAYLLDCFSETAAVGFKLKDDGLKLEKGASYELVSQKIFGEHTPNAFISRDYDKSGEEKSYHFWTGGDLTDTKVHVAKINPGYTCDPMFLGGDFGYHVSGSELIAMYVRKL